MTSNINYESINTNFPVAGQDNDTQVFRDNWDSIYTNFSAAKTEIEDLQNNVVRSDSSNDLGGNSFENAVTKNIVEAIVPASSDIVSSTLPIEFQSGSYQVFILGTDVDLEFSQFPATGLTVGKVTLELYSNSEDTRKVRFSLSGSGAENFKKNGFPTLTLSGIHDLEISSSTDPVIVEVWRHNSNNFYVKYVGQFV